MNLLVTGCFKYSNEQMETLRSLGFNIYFMQQEKETLPLEASEVDATVCNGLFLSHDIDEFSRLKFIQLTSAGFDRMPVEKIKARGIELNKARGVYSIPMAGWAMFRVLDLTSRVVLPYGAREWPMDKAQRFTRSGRNQGGSRWCW